MVRKIALEEHFLCPGFEDYWKTTVGNVDPAIYRQVMSSLRDFGEHRLGEMDEAGIERAVLSLAGPGVQIETGTATACRKAKECNDFLAKDLPVLWMPNPVYQNSAYRSGLRKRDENARFRIQASNRPAKLVGAQVIGGIQVFVASRSRSRACNTRVSIGPLIAGGCQLRTFSSNPSRSHPFVRPIASFRPGLHEVLVVARSGSHGWRISATAGLSLTAASTAAL